MAELQELPHRSRQLVGLRPDTMRKFHRIQKLRRWTLPTIADIGADLLLAKVEREEAILLSAAPPEGHYQPLGAARDTDATVPASDMDVSAAAPSQKSARRRSVSQPASG